MERATEEVTPPPLHRAAPIVFMSSFPISVSLCSREPPLTAVSGCSGPSNPSPFLRQLRLCSVAIFVLQNIQKRSR